MTIMLVGGGTAGHITPLLAVAHELKLAQPAIKIIAVTDRGNVFHRLLHNSPDIDEVALVSAGKFRRYHNESFFHKLTDFKTIWLNTRDVFRTLAGIAQARRLLKKYKPAVIFIKGGFVGVPIGVAARQLHTAFITHDSDTLPGLANRIIGKWAALHAVGMPAEFYTYPKEKTHYVGIPVSSHYKPVTQTLRTTYRNELRIPANTKVILVTGGSQGAVQLNNVMAKSLDLMLKDNSLYIIHQTGKGNIPQYTNKRYKTIEFSDELYKMSAAADLVVARAGANTFAELSVQGKAVILVPSPYLSGGHQVANAKHLAGERAAIYLEEKQILQHPNLFIETVFQIVNHTQIKQQLENNIKKLSKPHAARDIAKLILDAA